MRILVFGAGAMGSFIGGLLSQNHDITFIGRQQHMSKIRKSGLQISGKTELSINKKTIRTFESIEPLKKGCGPPELILVTVKSYDTKTIIPEIGKILGPDTKLLSLQNGLDSVELLRDSFLNNIVLGGTICHGVTYLGPGKIYHAGFGDTIVGALDPNNYKSAQEVSKILSEIGIETQLTKNICGEIWTKLAINASINPITAITGLKNGWLLREPKLENLLEQTCNEVINVAKISGIKLPKGPKGNILDRTKRVVERTADNKSSMLQDIENGKRTEIDSINGAVVRVGSVNNLTTPINSTLTILVKGLEQQNKKNN
jgi:2-dehydropantoate 2-reductase